MAYGLPVGAQDDFEMYRFLLFLGFLLNTCRQYFFLLNARKHIARLYGNACGAHDACIVVLLPRQERLRKTEQKKGFGPEKEMKEMTN